MDWFGAGSLFLALGRAVYEYYWATPADEAERERQQREILDAIRTSSQTLLDTMVALNIAELSGEVQGFLDIYDSYDADPNDPLEEARLESLISDSARVIGQLIAHIDRLPIPGSVPDPERDATFVNLALESAALAIPLTYLRVQAMIEREITYGAQEIDDARRYVGNIQDQLVPILPNLRERSDRRFSGLRVWNSPEAGVQFRVYYYRFNEANVMCLPTKSPDAFERSERMRASKMDIEYLRFMDGAAQVLSETIEEMARFRDASGLLPLGPPPADGPRRSTQGAGKNRATHFKVTVRNQELRGGLT